LPGWKSGLRGSTSLGAVACRSGASSEAMLPPYVKPYVKRQKNDDADAEAICEAVRATASPQSFWSAS
jgi:hypothetical protein